jgi:hypothetical protein
MSAQSAVYSLFRLEEVQRNFRKWRFAPLSKISLGFIAALSAVILSRIVFVIVNNYVDREGILFIP